MQSGKGDTDAHTHTPLDLAEAVVEEGAEDVDCIAQLVCHDRDGEVLEVELDDGVVQELPRLQPRNVRLEDGHPIRRPRRVRQHPAVERDTKQTNMSKRHRQV